MATSILPPAENTWDLSAITAGALVVLRLEASDVDEERVAQAAASATQLIDIELDMVPVDDTLPAFDASVEPTLVAAAVKLAVELYLNPPREDDDPVAVVRTQVSPWRARWGLA